MRLTQLLSARFGKWSYQYANLPERYIERASQQVYWRNPKGPQYRPNVDIKRKKFHFTTRRPWSAQFHQDNSPGKYHAKVFVEPVKEWSFFRGDRVQVLVGPDKGKQGIVRVIVEERNWVIVEGLNCMLREIGGRGNIAGMYVQWEKPLLVTNQVALVDPSDLKPTKVEWRYTEEGDYVRVSSRTGRIIPMPATMEDTVDYKTKGTYKEQPKDTKSEDVSEITFEPALKTFEMDIMDKMGIKEERIPPKTFWY